MNKSIVLLLGLVLAGTAAARDSASAASLADADRDTLADIIIDTWARHVDGDQLERWLAHVGERADNAPLAWLESAAAALDLRQAELALDGLAPLEPVTPAAFGEAGGNLVFNPLPPCRLLDTRLPSARSGVIAGDSERSFFGYGVPFQSSQGGDNSACGLGISTRPEALAITLAAVNPIDNGYLTAYPVDSERPLAASLNYTVGTVTSTGLILPINNATTGDEFIIYSRRDTHVVADVTGYFSRPQAAALECIDLEGDGDVIAPGITGTVTSPQCPATYTPSFGGCVVVSTNADLLDSRLDPVSGRTECRYRSNNAVANMEIRADGRCCRIPGR